MLTKTILRLTLFFTSIFIGIFSILHLYRMEITSNVIQKALDLQCVSVENVDGFFPLTVSASNISGQRHGQEVLKIKKLAFELNPLGLLIGQLTFSYLSIDDLLYQSESNPQSDTPPSIPTFSKMRDAFASLPLSPHIHNTSINGSFDGKHFKIQGEIGASTSADIDIDQGKTLGKIMFNPKGFEIQLPTHTLILKGSFNDFKEIPFEAQYKDFNFHGAIKNKVPGIYNGHMWSHDGALDVTLTYKNQAVTLQTLHLAQDPITIALKAPIVIDVSQGLSLDHGVFLINGESLDLKNVHIAETLCGTATLNLKNLTLLKSLHPSFKDLNLEGVLTAQGDLSGSLVNPQVSVKLDLANIKSPKVPLKTPLSLKATLKGDLFSPQFQSALDAGTELNAKSAGKIHQDGMDISHKIHIPLKVLAPILPKGDRMDGIVQGTIKTSGAFQTLKTEGRLHVDKGLYQNQIIGLHIRNIQGTLDIKQSEVITNIQGQDEFKGKLTVSGSCNPFDKRGDIKVQFIQFYLGQSDLFTGRTDGTINVNLTKNVIDGELTLDPVVVDIDQLTPASTPKLLPLDQEKKEKSLSVSAEKTLSPEKSPFFFDIKLRPKNHVIVHGFGIESTWTGDMKLYGHTPDFVGQFDLHKGTIDITGRILKFTHGRINFDHRIDEPILDLEITKKIDSYDVYVQLKGRPKSPKFTFLSSPTLTQEEVLALIMLGRKSAASSIGQLLEISSSLESLSNHGQSDSIFSKFRRAFGIEALEIKKRDQSSPSESPQALSIRKSITPNVAVVVEQGLSSTDEETKSSKATIEASITENLNLEIDATTQKSTAFGFSWIKRY